MDQSKDSAGESGPAVDEDDEGNRADEGFGKRTGKSAAAAADGRGSNLPVAVVRGKDTVVAEKLEMWRGIVRLKGTIVGEVRRWKLSLGRERPSCSLSVGTSPEKRERPWTVGRGKNEKIRVERRWPWTKI